MVISKTLFLDFLHCPKNIWLKLNKPELLEKEAPKLPEDIAFVSNAFKAAKDLPPQERALKVFSQFYQNEQTPVEVEGALLTEGVEGEPSEATAGMDIFTQPT